MAVFTIEAPDGRRIRVEAESEDLAMQGAKDFASKNPIRAIADLQKGLSSGNLRYSNLSRGEQDLVARDGRGAVSDVARSVARGVPFIGEWSDEINAHLNAATGGYLDGSKAKTFDERLEDNLAYERAKDRTYDEDSPVASFANRTAGGVLGTLAGMRVLPAAGALATTGRTLLGVGAKTLPGAVARGGVAGFAQGAAAGAGASEKGGFVDRGMGALTGGALGGAVGAAVPGVFGTIRGALSAGKNSIAPAPSTPLSELSIGARRFVGDIADQPSVANWQSELNRLGPDAMLADVSPEWAGVARGAAARPGSREVIVGALDKRDAAKNARLARDLDQHLGRAPIPSQVEAGLKASRGSLSPQYTEALNGARAVDTSGLAATLEQGIIDTRGPAQSAMQQVRQMLDIPGGTGVLDPSPRALLSTRQAIDGMLENEANSNVIMALTSARRQVDDALARAVPGIKRVDAQHAELARQSDALKRGGMVMDSGKTAIRPLEMAQELRLGALPQGEMIGPSGVPTRIQQGVRAEMDRIAGTNANDPVAMQRFVKGDGDWNRTKLGQIFGQDRADSGLAAIDRESRFRNTYNRVAGGSDTAQTQGFRQMLERAENPILGNGAPDMSAFGTTVSAAKWVGGMLTGHLGKERANRYATELARMAISTGLTRDQFVAALEHLGVRQQMISRMTDVATRAGLIGSREAAARRQER